MFTATCTQILNQLTLKEESVPWRQVAS